MLTRAVGYLNSIVAFHGPNRTIDVRCTSVNVNPNGNGAFVTACTDCTRLE